MQQTNSTNIKEMMDYSAPNPIKDYYIAYFDILGYRDFFRTQPDRAQVFLQSIHEAMIKTKNRITMFNFSPLVNAVGKMDVSVKIFSDNVMLCMEALEEPIEQLRILTFLQIVADIQRGFVVEYGLFIRGGVLKGPISLNPDYVFGQGLIDVVDMESKAQFPRIIIDKDLFSTLTTNHLFSQEDADRAVRINQALNDGKEVSTEEQEFCSRISFKSLALGILNRVIFQLIIKWPDENLILNYLYSLDDPSLFSEQFKNDALTMLQSQSPYDYELATLPPPHLDSILQRNKEKVVEQLNKWGSNADIKTGDMKGVEDREKVLRKYVWAMAFHNEICQKYEKMDYFISTQCNCDKRFVKMTINVLEDENVLKQGQIQQDPPQTDNHEQS